MFFFESIPSKKKKKKVECLEYIVAETVEASGNVKYLPNFAAGLRLRCRDVPVFKDSCHAQLETRA